MTKKTNAKKTKLGKLTSAPAAAPAPAPVEQGPVATPASMIYRNIKALLLGALHPGAHAKHVTESVEALDQVIAAIEADAAKKTDEPAASEAKVDG